MTGRVVRLERNPLGPRLYVLGLRAHECHVGLLMAAGSAAAAIVELGGTPVAALGALGAWLIVKDWRDLHPATRDTAAWSFGLHRVPASPGAEPSRSAAT